MIHILTVDGEYESALRLGYDSTITEHSGDLKEYLKDVVVRWGNSSPIFTKIADKTQPAEFPRVINPAMAIRLNVDKCAALKILSKVVDTPKVWEQGKKVPPGVEAVHRVIHHHGGEGFNVQTGPFVVGKGFYATRWIPSTIEYRVWFCGENTMCGIRTKRSPCTDKYPCRSMWGYDFKESVPAQLHDATLAATKAIGLECGAADILDYGGRYYFLELNSAATIDKQVIEDFYRNGLVKLIAANFAGY